MNSGGWADKSTREPPKQGRKWGKDIGVSGLVVVMLAGLIFLSYSIFGHPDFVFTVGGLLLFVLLARKIDQTIVPAIEELRFRGRNARKGARAEEQIGDLLDHLGGECVVLHDVHQGQANIDHLAFRKDGAVFLVETKSHHGKITQQDGELHHNGQPLEKNFVRQTHEHVFWLKEFLQARLGMEPWIDAVIVFPNGHVEKDLKINGVAIMNATFLSEWIRRHPGNPKVAARLWPEIENLKNELLTFTPNHLAPQAALG